MSLRIRFGTHLAAIRADTDGAIGVGGATLATAPVQAGLLDELLLARAEASLGAGIPFQQTCTGAVTR